MTERNHTYVIPAYGKSPHLEECLQSLICQTAASEIVVSTSTPFEGIDALVRRYGARVFVHGPNNGIGTDWNAAFSAATTPLVTLAHQDDLYDPLHAAEVIATFDKHADALLVFTDYRELQEGRLRPLNRTLAIKIVQRELGFMGRSCISSPALKRAVLRFGNSIPCPAVPLHKALVPDFRFRTDMRTNMDWIAWLSLASRPGKFAYLRKPRLLHRIHSDSETTACISDGVRESEDYEIFSMLWPAPVATALTRLYGNSYATNK